MSVVRGPVEVVELPTAEEARKMAVLKSKFFNLVISYIDGKIEETIQKGKFVWKSSSEDIDGIVRVKVNVEGENGEMREKYVLRKLYFDDLVISEWIRILSPYARERYESKGYKVTVSEDHVLEISFL